MATCRRHWGWQRISASATASGITSSEVAEPTEGRVWARVSQRAWSSSKWDGRSCVGPGDVHWVTIPVVRQSCWRAHVGSRRWRQPLESAVGGDDLDVVGEIHLSRVLAGGVDPAVVATADRGSRSAVDPDVGMTGNPGDAVLAVPSDSRTAEWVDQTALIALDRRRSVKRCPGWAMSWPSWRRSGR